MQVSIETGSYNDRRYGKPWIASVTFDGATPVYAFGEFCGDDSEGELRLNIAAGNVFARGQKDFRKPANSAPTFYIAFENGEHVEVSKVEARRHLESVADVPESDVDLSGVETAALIAELARRGVDLPE